MKPKMAEIDVQCQSLSIIFVCAVDTKEWLALVSICEIDVTSFSDDERGVN
jgi:hypothetical protein